MLSFQAAGGPERPDLGRLEAMLRHLRHRGPDGSGISQHGACGLVHTRLSIIDLLAGQQPMHRAEEPMPTGAHWARAGALHLVFNGEIYNHRALRRKLEQRGARFTSDHSDSEVLLLGYRAWGPALPRHLHGMFAFAIWDETRQELFLCRDRAGKKPLYFRHLPGEVRFASLVGTLMAGRASGETLAPDPAALLHFLQLGYPGAQGMLTGIGEVPPAHWIRFDRSGHRESGCYWQPPPISRSSTAMGAVAALREVLEESVASRLEADVPLGCFLSGGIDSSLVAAFAQRRRRALGAEALRTFSVAMPEATYDESPHALAVARHLGTEHTVLTASPATAFEDLRFLMATSGEPTADSSLLPTYWLCQAARPFVRVALSGDGGDELFGGYDRYRALRLLGSFRPLLATLPVGWLQGTRAKSRRVRLGRLVDAARAGTDPAAQYQRMIQLFSPAQVASLRPDLQASRTNRLSDWPDEPDRVHAAMRWDLTHYLPMEVLRKVDRASMAVALEVRCPLLDTQVMDLAGHLPARVLMPGGRPKGLLRALAADLLPVEVVQRRKMGFAIPIGQWLGTSMREELRSVLFSGTLDRFGLEMTTIRQMEADHAAGRVDHSHRLFALLQLGLWSQWLS